MSLSGRHLGADARLFVDGRRRAAKLRLEQDERVTITLGRLPTPGPHVLQLQSPLGLFSNELLFYAAEDAVAARALRARLNPGAAAARLTDAVARGELAAVEGLIAKGVALDEPRLSDGMTPLGVAAMHGHLAVARALLTGGARPGAPNRDGNTALHIAAFFTRGELVRALLDAGAPLERRNARGERAVDVVSGAWSPGLEGFYRAVLAAAGLELSIAEVRRRRPQLARLLRAAGR